MRVSSPRCHLSPADTRFVAERLPRDIRELLSKHAPNLYVGGGFIRAVVAGEEPSDIDLFGHDVDTIRVIANELLSMREGSRLHESKNALTLITPNRMTVQFITRWVFPNGRDLVKSFDFTVCQAGIWREGRNCNDAWVSSISERFYMDLAGRRLVYTSPVRDEEAGGSLLRVLKYVKRGYSIQVCSLSDVLAQLMSKKADDEDILSYLDATLREVDPQLNIDGLEVLNDHESEDKI